MPNQILWIEDFETGPFGDIIGTDNTVFEDVTYFAGVPASTFDNAQVKNGSLSCFRDGDVNSQDYTNDDTAAFFLGQPIVYFNVWVYVPTGQTIADAPAVTLAMDSTPNPTRRFVALDFEVAASSTPGVYISTSGQPQQQVLATPPMNQWVQLQIEVTPSYFTGRVYAVDGSLLGEAAVANSFFAGAREVETTDVSHYHGWIDDVTIEIPGSDEGRLKVYVQDEAKFKLAAPLPGEGEGALVTVDLEFDNYQQSNFGSPLPGNSIVGTNPWGDDDPATLTTMYTYAPNQSSSTRGQNQWARLKVPEGYPPVEEIQEITLWMDITTTQPAGHAHTENRLDVSFFQTDFPGSLSNQIGGFGGDDEQTVGAESTPLRAPLIGVPVTVTSHTFWDADGYVTDTYPDVAQAMNDGELYVYIRRLTAGPQVGFPYPQEYSQVTRKVVLTMTYLSAPAGRLKVWVEAENQFKFAGPWAGENDGFGRLKVYVADEGVWKNA